MTLTRLLKLANRGYPNRDLRLYFRPDETEREPEYSWDTLAQFIVRELRDTYDPDASDLDQLAEAVRVLDAAKRDIDGVIDMLMRAASNRRRRTLSQRQ
jgi:hypothetical protein